MLIVYDFIRNLVPVSFIVATIVVGLVTFEAAESAAERLRK